MYIDVAKEHFNYLKMIVEVLLLLDVLFFHIIQRIFDTLYNYLVKGKRVLICELLYFCY